MFFQILPKFYRFIHSASGASSHTKLPTSQLRCELLFKRKHKMFKPNQTKLHPKQICNLFITNKLQFKIRVGFQLICNHAFTNQIRFVIAGRFLGESRETFEDNILTFIRKLFTRQNIQ